MYTGSQRFWFLTQRVQWFQPNNVVTRFRTSPGCTSHVIQLILSPFTFRQCHIILIITFHNFHLPEHNLSLHIQNFHRLKNNNWTSSLTHTEHYRFRYQPVPSGRLTSLISPEGNWGRDYIHNYHESGASTFPLLFSPCVKGKTKATSLSTSLWPFHFDMWRSVSLRNCLSSQVSNLWLDKH